MFKHMIFFTGIPDLFTAQDGWYLFQKQLFNFFFSCCNKIIQALL